MGSLLALLPGLVPDGPLHPGLALGGVVVGVAAAAMAGRSTRAWTALVVVGWWFVTAAVNGDRLAAAFTDRGDRAVVISVTIAVALAAVSARPSRSTATVMAIAACAGVWAIVPDTEAPLLAGAVLVGATAVTLLPDWLEDSRRRIHGVLLVLPVAAAAIGSVGRPARFGPGILAAALTAALGLTAWQVLRVLWRRQRAGTPITVAPAGTSSTTTAPAPTTAS